MLSKLMTLVANEDGQGMVEYAYIMLLMVLVAIILLGSIGDKVANMFINVNNRF